MFSFIFLISFEWVPTGQGGPPQGAARSSQATHHPGTGEPVD